MSLITRIFGTYSEHQLKKLNATVDYIESLADEYKAKSNEELAGMTDEFKARLAAGATLDDILPHAFAAICEADDRILGKRPYRVQLIGGIILHQGRIAEMKTGEGKTLVETMPAYLNALTGEGVHIVTVNEYLARRDAEEMGNVYEFMGLTTGLVVHGQTGDEKRAAYNADITYGTNNEFGFDYLRDNMVVYKSQMMQRGHVYAIIDEVDSILIDEARTPLIISGRGEESSEMYERTDTLVRRLRRFVIKEMEGKTSYDEVLDEKGESCDYIVDEKNKKAILTAAGIRKAEEYFEIEDISDPANATIAHHLNQALHAYGCMQVDRDYVVTDDGVMIIDQNTGRMMPGRRYSNGLHQAIEAKEHVTVQRENRTLATITFQNYFRMYKKLAGMTGTALTEEDEFREIYGLDVVEIPTNRPMIRIDNPDAVYKNLKGKYDAIVRQIKECHEKGQPILVGTITIEKSEELSRRLKREGIKHNILNAKYHAKEAEIVAQAGRLGAVTISTNMAGRGTDIMLGGNPEYMAKAEMRRMEYDEDLIAMATGTAEIDDEAVRESRRVFAELYEKYKKEVAPEADKVRAAGGLYILGTERHESRRIDNQLRGRAGRQGDPGESQFFLSLEDDLMRLFGSERMMATVDRLGLDEDTPISVRILSNSIESAQKRIEADHFRHRKNVLTYDDVMNQQRTVIYNQRQSVLDGENVSATIREMVFSTVEEETRGYLLADEKADWDLDGLRRHFRGLLTTDEDFRYDEKELKSVKDEDIVDEMLERAEKRYEQQEALFGSEIFREIERKILLETVDRYWMDHIDAMDDLKGSVGLQSYGQRDPVTEYRLQGAYMFDAMVSDIREETTRKILSAIPVANPTQRVQLARPVTAGFAGGAEKKPAKVRASLTVRKTEAEIGRNDPCPCGSGKKYKKCCGANHGATSGE